MVKIDSAVIEAFIGSMNRGSRVDNVTSKIKIMQEENPELVDSLEGIIDGFTECLKTEGGVTVDFIVYVTSVLVYNSIKSQLEINELE